MSFKDVTEEVKMELHFKQNIGSELINIRIIAKELENEPKMINLSDITGNLIYTEKLIGDQIHSIDISGLLSGLYVIVVNNNKSRISKLFIKK